MEGLARIRRFTRPHLQHYASRQGRNPCLRRVLQYLGPCKSSYARFGVAIRVKDPFLTYADEIGFYYRDEVKQDAQLAAKWVRNPEDHEFLGQLEIIKPSLYEKIKKIHNNVTKVLNRSDLDWEVTVEINSKILRNEID